MNQPNAGQHGLQHPQPLQHPRSAGLIQQRRPDSPHQPQSLQHTPQGPYASPHSSTHSISQQQQHHSSPYIGSSVHGLPNQHAGETNFFGAHPSPYSTNSAAGSYASSEPTDAMATQAAISRQQYPPISSYQTPPSNSPASIHSPPTDAHGRPLYGIPPMAQQMYYPQYQQMHQQPYAQHPSAGHHPSITSAPGMLMSHQQPQTQMPQPSMPQQHHQQQQSHPHQQHHQQQAHQQPGPIDTKPQPQPNLQRPPSVMGTPHGTPQTPSGPGIPGMPHSAAGANPGAAPGPIPATTPLVVRQDGNGVQWIAFEYSRDRVKMEYTIRCDVESVNVDNLPQEFKSNNCVYPRACVGKDQYKGNRLHYESECNAVGWALAQLNPNLREKRGLIQRAVDSWRNSNQDPKLRSRRVRRMAKIHTRKAQMTPTGTTVPGAPGVSTPGLQPPPGLNSGGARRTNFGPGQMLHHSESSEGDHMSAAEYHASPAHHQNMSHGQPDLAQQQPRYAQSFYPSYPHQSSVGDSSGMPPVHDTMDHPMQSRASILATPATASSREDDDETNRALFGDLPANKERKFLLIDDPQRGTRVRVRVMLDQVKMDDMPDAHLKQSSVYPRSYYPRQMRSPVGSPNGRGQWDDFNDDEGASGVAPTFGKTMVPVSLMDGSEAQVPVPRMTKSRRSREVALNELGYRMSWHQGRTFHKRPLFLQRSLDAYRNKRRSTMLSSGTEPANVPLHFETRPGKRKWQERARQGKRRADSP